MQNCYNVGKKEVDDRLTNKHIKTLSFLQEIVEENKRLKARIQELEEQCSECGDLHDVAKTAKERIAQIQKQYLERADEINAMLLEKHKLELMKQVEEKIAGEKQWQEEKRVLLEQLATHKRLQAEQEAGLAVCKDHQQQIEILQLKVDALNQETDRLKEKNAELEQENKAQQTELQKLRSQSANSAHMADDVSELQEQIKEKDFQISRLQEMLTKRDGKEQEEALNTLRIKLTKLTNEKSVWETRETEYIRIIENLKQEMSALRRALADSELMRTEMHAQLEQVLAELAKLKKQMSARDKEKENFKEFIQMKREIQLLQEENEALKAKSKKGSGKVKKNSLPSLSSDGHTSYMRLDSAGKSRQPPSYGMLFNGKS